MASEDSSASARWRRLVTDRLEEMERLSPGVGVRSGAFWERRAKRRGPCADLTRADDDPFLRRLRRKVGPQDSVLDVGAGSGRLALPLAAGVGHVTAVDRSEAMLSLLRKDARAAGIRNVTAVHSAWEAAKVEPADIAFSAFVLSLVEDAPGFLTKLDQAAGRHAFLYLGAYSGDAVLDPLWRHFHGAPRAPGPTHLDALAVLRELGIEPEVKPVELHNRRRFETVDDAVEHYRAALLLPDTADAERELAGLLEGWLMGRRGARRSPLRSVPAAIIHWVPAARR